MPGAGRWSFSIACCVRERSHRPEAGVGLEGLPVMTSKQDSPRSVKRGPPVRERVPMAAHRTQGPMSRLLDASILLSFDRTGCRRHAAGFDPTDLRLRVQTGLSAPEMRRLLETWGAVSYTHLTLPTSDLV